MLRRRTLTGGCGVRCGRADLSLIRDRLQSQSYYMTLEIFLADLRRMIVNCKTFNDDTTTYYQCAEAMKTVVHAALKQVTAWL